MQITRRDVFRTSALAAGGLAMGLTPRRLFATIPIPHPPHVDPAILDSAVENARTGISAGQDGTATASTVAAFQTSYGTLFSSFAESGANNSLAEAIQNNQSFLLNWEPTPANLQAALPSIQAVAPSITMANLESIFANYNASGAELLISNPIAQVWQTFLNDLATLQSQMQAGVSGASLLRSASRIRPQLEDASLLRRPTAHLRDVSFCGFDTAAALALAVLAFFPGADIAIGVYLGVEMTLGGLAFGGGAFYTILGVAQC